MKTKMNKKNIIIVALILGVVIGLSFLISYFVMKPKFEVAIQEYADVFSEYRNATTAFEKKCTLVETQNKEIKKAFDELQAVIDAGEKPYHPERIPKANEAINNGKIAIVTIPEWNKDEPLEVSKYNVFQLYKVKKETERTKLLTTELLEITNSLQIPDSVKVVGEIKSAKDSLERSIRQLKQVTCPEESFVLQRISNLREEGKMRDIVALTEDSDTNNYIGKPGWYTSKIIFHHEDVEHYGLDSGLYTLSEIGNPAGGCVEV